MENLKEQTNNLLESIETRQTEMQQILEELLSVSWKVNKKPRRLEIWSSARSTEELLKTAHA